MTGSPWLAHQASRVTLLSLSCLEGVRGEVTVGTWVRKSEPREGPLTSAWQ